jgi:hypothetical protein
MSYPNITIKNAKKKKPILLIDFRLATEADNPAHQQKPSIHELDLPVKMTSPIQPWIP